MSRLRGWRIIFRRSPNFKIHVNTGLFNVFCLFVCYFTSPHFVNLCSAYSLVFRFFFHFCCFLLPSSLTSIVKIKIRNNQRLLSSGNERKVIKGEPNRVWFLVLFREVIVGQVDPASKI